MNNFDPAILPKNSGTGPSIRFLFDDGGRILLHENLKVPEGSGLEGIYLGDLNGVPCFTARQNTDTKNDLEPFEIRSLHSQIPNELYSLIGYASQILTWSENHQFCSRCGTKAEASETERAMRCPSCGLMNYPRISASMIVAVTRRDELLMARGHHFPKGLYSVVSGFLEPGETMEQCVAREVMEETGLDVCNIRYHSSQPWPFPHSIMIGFTADYAGGELKIDPKEIEDAGWYTPDHMPARIPSASTIARTLIDDYLAGTKETSNGQRI
jgi:NAD+ diphosphatase